MLTIRKEQMKALAAYMQQAFEDRVLKQMATEYPQQFKLISAEEPSDSKARAVVRDGVARAAGYGITAEADVERYIALMFAVDPQFETWPKMKWAVAILNDAGISGNGRMELIHQQLPQRMPKRES